MDDDTPNEDFSELSTRSVFSWTFFTDGVRPKEKHFWDHEWLEILVRRQARDETSGSSSSQGSMKTRSDHLDRIQQWRDKVRDLGGSANNEP